MFIYNVFRFTRRVCNEPYDEEVTFGAVSAVRRCHAPSAVLPEEVQSEAYLSVEGALGIAHRALEVHHHERSAPGEEDECLSPSPSGVMIN